MRVFIDTAPLIYLIESQSQKADIVERQLANWISAGARLTTSSLTLLELLVVPKRQKNIQLVQKYRTLLKDLLSEPLIPLSEPIAELAAEVRGTYGFKTPDAIQIAAAIYTGSDALYTSDRRLAQCRDIAVLIIGENSQ